MKLYNEDHIDEREISRQVSRWRAQQLVTPQQADAIDAAFPNRFKQVNSAIEIGSFLFTTLAVMSLYGLVSIQFNVFDSEASPVFGLLSLAYAGGLLVFTHYMVRRNNLCRNGTDNALLVLAVSIAVWGLLSLIASVRGAYPPFWQGMVVAMPLLLAGVWWSGDIILTYLTVAAFYAALFDRLTDFGWGKAALPFVLMGVSGMLYALVRREPRRAYYAEALGVVRWAALAVLLAAGNYYVVRELNSLLTNPTAIVNHVSEPPEISLAGLFWLLTFALPATYLLVGVRQRDRMFLILGMLGAGAALATLQHYVLNWPTSVLLAVTGALVIGVAALLIRYLRQPHAGLTDVPDDEPPHALIRHVGTFTTLQGVANAQNQPHLRFGGGDFSGSGAGGAV